MRRLGPPGAPHHDGAFLAQRGDARNRRRMRPEAKDQRMTISRRTVLGAGLAAPLLASPLLSRPAAAQRANGILRFGLSAFPPNLQPWVSTGASAGTVKMLTHRSLVTYDSKGELRGELAESWTIDGSGAWVFKLRQGCLFHNGEPVTAEDVKWSIEQIAGEKSTAYMRSQFQGIERVEIPDPRSIRIVTKDPQATLPTWFANYNTFIIWRNSTANEPIGAGPFRLAGQERGSSLSLVAFDKFYKPGFPKLKGIKFIVYADENLRNAALQSGDVDMIEYVPWQSMAAVEADQRLKLDTVEGPFMDVLFNGTKPPFNDARVRRAVAHAIKREDIVKVAFFGRGKPLEGLPIVEGTPWYDKELAHGWNYDPARAKALLTEAGLRQRLPDHAALNRAVRHAQGHRRGRAAASGGDRHPMRAAAAGLVDPRQPWFARPVRHGDPRRLGRQQRSRRVDRGARHLALADPWPLLQGRCAANRRRLGEGPRRIRPGQARRDLQGDAARGIGGSAARRPRLARAGLWHGQGRQGLHQPARRADDVVRRHARRDLLRMSAIWFAHRILIALVLAWIVATIVFMALHMVPGDPAELLLSTGGTSPDPATVAELREKLGLNQPILVQYGSFLAGLLRADLGNSLVDDYPVLSEIALRLPRTLELIFAGTLLAIAIGVPAGVYAALHRGGRFDRIASGVTALLLAIPVFVVGTLLVLLFAQTLRLMPAGGFTPLTQDPVLHLKLLTLPAIAIGKGLAAVLFRMTRASMLDALANDYVRTARAKGLAPGRVLFVHVLRNALNPVVTVLGLQMGTLLGGTVLVEYVFNWPGLSTPLLRAVEARDYPMVVGIVLTISVLFLLINLIVELIHALLDPRVSAP
jgi:ABC-type dipeptide/oligopeptide/nickel transport system permease component